MEERAGERRCFLHGSRLFFEISPSLSPTLSHSFVMGEGEKSGAVSRCAPDYFEHPPRLDETGQNADYQVTP
jgi:hypothetical protein